MTDPRIRYDVLANAQGADDVRRLATELEKLDDSFDPAVQARAGELAEELRQLGNQQTALSDFERALVDANEAGRKLEQSSEALRKLQQALQGVAEPTRKQAGEMQRLADQERRAREAFGSTTAALSAARTGLERLGVSSADLAGANANLEASLGRVRSEVSQIGQQGQAVQAYAALANATDKARSAFQAADEAVDAYKRGLAEVDQPTALQATRLKALTEAARQAQLAYQGTAQQQAQAGTALRAAGVDVDRLAQAQGRLIPAQREVSKATDTATQAQKRNASSLKDLGAESQTATAKLGAMKGELLAAGAALAGAQVVLGGAAKSAGEFGTAMAEVATLLDDNADIDGLSESVRKLTLEYGGQAPAQAKALYQIISAGVSDATQAVALLDAANRLSVGGVTDVRTAADGLTTALNAYGPAAGSAAQVSDALFVAMRAGKTTVGELSSNIGNVAPIAAQAGVGLQELLAAVAALTTGGVGTAQSITQLRGVISSVLKPSAEAAALARDLGLQFDVQALKAQGLAGFLEEVQRRTGGNTETMALLFGQVEALGAVLSLTGNQAGTFTSILDSMSDSVGATEAAFGKLAETPAFAARRLEAALRDLQLSLGLAVTAFSPMIESLTSALNLFNDLPGPIKSTVAGVGALTVAVPLLGLALGRVASALGLVRDLLRGKAAAAASVAAPAAAAAAGTTAMGRAAAGAAPAIAAAGTATGLLARGLGLLKAALPVGLVLTVIELASAFFKVKKEAEEADKAVADMLAAPASSGVRTEVQQTTRALSDASQAARAATREAQAQVKAAREAAKALGVDVAQASAGVSEEFGKQADQLAVLVQNLDALRATGVNTGAVVSDALSRMIASARNETELAALKARIEALGSAGEISKSQVSGLMQSIQDQARKATGSIDEIDRAYKRLGLTTKKELSDIAADTKRAWEVIQRDANSGLSVKQAAFKRYAESAIAANDGVADSTLKAAARSVGLAVEVDKTGRAIVVAMDKASSATDRTRRRFNELGQEIDSTGNAINQLAGRIDGALTRAQDLLGTAARAARNEGINSSNSIDARFNSSSGFLPVTGTGTIFTPPPDNSGDWVWQPMLNRNREGGQWVRSPAAEQRDFRQQQASLGLVQDQYGIWRPGASAVPAPPAPPPAPAPTAATAIAGGSTYTVNVTIGNKQYSIGTTSQSASDKLIDALEAAQAAGG